MIRGYANCLLNKVSVLIFDKINLKKKTKCIFNFVFFIIKYHLYFFGEWDRV